MVDARKFRIYTYTSYFSYFGEVKMDWDIEKELEESSKELQKMLDEITARLGMTKEEVRKEAEQLLSDIENDVPFADLAIMNVQNYTKLVQVYRLALYLKDDDYVKVEMDAKPTFPHGEVLVITPYSSWTKKRMKALSQILDLADEIEVEAYKDTATIHFRVYSIYEYSDLD